MTIFDVIRYPLDPTDIGGSVPIIPKKIWLAWYWKDLEGADHNPSTEVIYNRYINLVYGYGAKYDLRDKLVALLKQRILEYDSV